MNELHFIQIKIISIYKNLNLDQLADDLDEN